MKDPNHCTNMRLIFCRMKSLMTGPQNILIQYHCSRDYTSPAGTHNMGLILLPMAAMVGLILLSLTMGLILLSMTAKN